VDFAFDLVEVEGKPAAKRGKFGGRKSPYRCDACLAIEIETEKCPRCGAKTPPLFKKYLSKGKLVEDLPKVDAIRDHTVAQLAKLGLAK